MPRITIHNRHNVIDSRDIIERIEELNQQFLDNGDKWDSDEDAAEFAALSKLANEGEDASDWEYGVSLIRDDYFVEYVREMLEDCGEIPRDLPHYVVVDWHKTADNVRVDYFDVDFDGVTYWVR